MKSIIVIIIILNILLYVSCNPEIKMPEISQKDFAEMVKDTSVRNIILVNRKFARIYLVKGKFETYLKKVYPKDTNQYGDQPHFIIRYSDFDIFIRDYFKIMENWPESLKVIPVSTTE
jgi:hypothetical protein